MNLTKNFTLEEFIRSDTAFRLHINNVPPDAMLPVITRTCEGLERVRALLNNRAIILLSGYRCVDLNAIVGGSPTSQHMKGEAADIICPLFGDVHALALFISTNMMPLGIDQVIKEKNAADKEWVHVSFSLEPRYQALTITPAGPVAGIV